MCDPEIRKQTLQQTQQQAEQRQQRKAAERLRKRSIRSRRFQDFNAFIDFTIAEAGLSPAEALVWLVLFRDTQRDGTCRTGQGDIARRTGMGVRTVRRAIASLKCKGLLSVVNRGRPGSGPSCYRIHPVPTIRSTES
jgi:CRP-like cAMP-binding protein